MDLERSATVVPRLVWLAEAASTNAELVQRASGAEGAEWTDLSVLATDNQTRGRGRLGRSWAAPAGASLAISILVRPAVPIESLSWLPLIAGVAMCRAANEQLTATGGDLRANVKWPNDVLIGRQKLSGILSEVVPESSGEEVPAESGAEGQGGTGSGAEGRAGARTPAVVVGAGVNLFLTEDELPVPTATSLTLAGASGFTADDVLFRYLSEFVALYGVFTRFGGDAVESGIAAVVSDACGTVGQAVSVELPGGEIVTGLATALDGGGRLLVSRDSDARTFAVSAGDVTHLRY